ncbi:FAD-linked oxidase C-terminal domain-containing protein [Methylobacterium gnaphalii]|uniref:FAD-binding protein n=1 Tax=Methylobacterium gnaphalii TaxID=1010610 RepID=A0A512JR22_9HYPH|nr:FAD-linked oxidase C-terminal domain-containing protein [Methylobacterium gnaphalii]GEP12323.1 FAD-binding protein [Methylobacterium gnaphalii]GJD70896.1 putative FAD-linked oxidoreductase [Methylobacterium gnaphalii]GLS50894.1 FAD-binding protein [Methylobacterium gnaphalii]
MIQFPSPNKEIIDRRLDIIQDLAALLPGESLIHTKEELKAYDTDALTAYRRVPLAVALPTKTEEVAAVLAYCNRYGVKVVARGAGTSLAGGAIPQEDAIVVGLSKMSRLLDVNYRNRTARVQAGMTNLSISDAVGSDGFFYAPDPSSQLACSIGGNIGMNSGGAHCLKYGVTTNNLLGVKMVLIDGTVLDIGGEHLDAAGYDLLGLVCGSEGQLGIVTEATVRIVRAAEQVRAALMGFDSAEAAGAAVAEIIAAGIIPVALEYMDRTAIQISENYAKAGYPLDVEAMLIVEVEGTEEENDATLREIINSASKHGPRNVRVAQNSVERNAIWKGRKATFGATGRISDYICMDGTIPTTQLPYVLRRTSEIIASYGLRVANVFHAGDGNLHPLILFDINQPGEMEKAEAAGEELLKLCVEVGGCLTGEHGVGIEKRDLMHFQYSAVDLNQQMRARAAFDPAWLLNPAKVFPLTARIAA